MSSAVRRRASASPRSSGGSFAAFAGLACLACLACLGACSDQGARERPAPPATGSTASAIVGGTVDTTRPDVLLLRDDTATGFRCTATLIAPNLVITARHCVGKRAVPNATTLCKGGATTDGAQALPNYQGDLAAMPMYVSASPSSPLLARGKKIYDDDATTTCSHDVALIELDPPIAGIAPSPIRRTPLAQGDPLVAMGFGWTDHNASVNATERMKGATSVLALGPIVYSFKPNGDPMATSQLVAIAAGEIGVQGITMTGDSGGPAFDSTGQLAALVSRGYADASYGPGTFTAVAAHLATIDAALVASGNPPVADAGSDAHVDTLPPPGGRPAADSGMPPRYDGPPGDDVLGKGTPPSGDSSGGGGSGGCSLVRGAHRSSPASDGAAAALAITLGLLVARRRRRRPVHSARTSHA